MKVTREVQVDRFHRQHLAVAAAGGAALHAEDRAQRGLAKRERSIFAQTLQTLSEGDGGRRFARTGRHARSGGDEDQTAFFLTGRIERYLRLVAAVGFEFAVGEAGGVRELIDGNELGFLSDFNIGLHRENSKKVEMDGIRYEKAARGAYCLHRGRSTAELEQTSSMVSDEETSCTAARSAVFDAPLRGCAAVCLKSRENRGRQAPKMEKAPPKQIGRCL